MFHDSYHFIKTLGGSEFLNNQNGYVNKLVFNCIEFEKHISIFGVSVSITYCEQKYRDGSQLRSIPSALRYRVSSTNVKHNNQVVGCFLSECLFIDAAYELL